MSWRRRSQARWCLLVAALAGCAGSEPGGQDDGVQRIAFQALTAGAPTTPRLASIRADGTGYTNLEDVPNGFADHPVATPDGASIIYSSNTENGVSWRILPSEGGTSVTFPVPPDVYTPVWSPDGRNIAWMHVVTGHTRLGVAGRGSSTITDLTPADYFIEQYPSWAPDNRSLAVKRQVDLTWDIYVASRAGAVQPLVVGDGPVFEPDWSLSKNKIAYVRPYAEAPANGIYIVDPDGSNARQLVSGDYSGSAIWSPDGNTIAHWREQSQSIILIDVASGATRSLPLPMFVYPVRLPWSRDGLRLLLYGEGGMSGPGIVYTMALDGTVTRVSPDSVSADFPVWVR